MKPARRRVRITKKQPTNPDVPEIGIETIESRAVPEGQGCEGSVNVSKGRRSRKIVSNDVNNDSAAPVVRAASRSVSVGMKARRRGRVGKEDVVRRRRRLPKIKDLSVTLGLEKPQQKLSKVQISQCNDDELLEQRFNEEMYKLNNLEEVLRLSNVGNIGSDDDSLNGCGTGFINLSDEDPDETNVDENGETRSPRPLPRRRRGKNTSINRSSRNVEVPKEEVKEMRMIIRSSMRKSLTSNKNDITSDDFDFLDSDNEDCGGRDKTATNEPETETTSNFILYRSFRQLVEIQDRWVTEATAQGVQLVDCDQLIRCNQDRKRRLPKQLQIEHMNWVSIAVKTEGEVNVTRNGLLAWLPNFQMEFIDMYPLLQQYGAPGSDTYMETLLRIAVVKVREKLVALFTSLLSARMALHELRNHVTNVYYEKRRICTDFEAVHDSLSIRGVRYDESSVWGLRPIRLALEPPYLKTEDGLLAYPMTPDTIKRVNYYNNCFFKRDKQKWTTKDLQQLKTCIRETLYSRRVCVLGDRYEVLMADCLRQYEDDMNQDGRLNAPPLEPYRRRRGRPKKSELEYSSKYGIIYPVFATLSGGISIRNEVSPRILSEWRETEEKHLKTKTYEELVFMENERVDWASVANKMVVKSRKHRTAEDCELAWRHEVHPSVNDKRWGVEESRRLKDIYARLRNDWFAIAQELNVQTQVANKPGRTPYQCFFRVRNRLDPPKKVTWTKELDEQVLEKLKDSPGNWRLVAATINDPAATKRQVIERYKKTINPVLRNGAFTRVEDCLLILTIEKLKPFLAREGHFGCLLAYLPWRCETTWRDRANNLFSDWIVPWTLEEDRMLLKLARTMNRNWQKISEEFTSFKNRKGCLTRYKILMRRLKDERFNNSLEAYHEAYAMTRYNVFQYKHLKEILELLTKVKNNPPSEKHQHFVGLLRDKEPSEVRLQHMLLTFDKSILESAITSLARYVQTRDNYWKNWISRHGKRKRTFDRRTFHPENPQSVASALHIRGLELKPKEDIPNLSDFEDEVYKFYARFRRTKALKMDADRPYIPDAKTLAQWSAVSRLVGTPVDELEDVPLKRKWKSLMTDTHVAQSYVKKRRIIDRIKTPSWLTSRRASIRGSKSAMPAMGVKQRKRRRARNSSGGGKISVTVNEEGYLLIPPETDIKRSMKRGRPRINKNDVDADFSINPRSRTDVSIKRLKKRGRPRIKKDDVDADFSVNSRSGTGVSIERSKKRGRPRINKDDFDPDFSTNPRSQTDVSIKRLKKRGRPRINKDDVDADFSVNSRSGTNVSFKSYNGDVDADFSIIPSSGTGVSIRRSKKRGRPRINKDDVVDVDADSSIIPSSGTNVSIKRSIKRGRPRLNKDDF